MSDDVKNIRVVTLSLDPVASKVDYVGKRVLSSSSGRITAVDGGANRGLFVVVAQDEDLPEGTKMMECTASSIALDPMFYKTRCGFCARTYASSPCSSCLVVGLCSKCAPLDDHKHECTALRALANIFTVDEGDPQIDPSHFLTCRLLCRLGRDLDWDLCKCLHEATLPQGIDSDIKILCSQLAPALPWLTCEIYKQALARVIGCSHALTDVSLPLGAQVLGRGLFLNHSFYNHDCSPNSFLSCAFNDDDEGVTARLHLLSTVKKGDEISISYIPTSGLAVQERQERLLVGYGFRCQCQACRIQKILLPPNADVQPIREIQFSCNDRLIQQRNVKDVAELEHIIDMVQMTQRGIRNQDIPSCHEVSIEAHRLLAAAYGMLDRVKEATEHYEKFFDCVLPLSQLFDPVARATQCLEYSFVTTDLDVCAYQRKQTVKLLQVALGSDHSWVLSLNEEILSKHPIKKTKFTI